MSAGRSKQKSERALRQEFYYILENSFIENPFSNKFREGSTNEKPGGEKGAERVQQTRVPEKGHPRKGKKGTDKG